MRFDPELELELELELDADADADARGVASLRCTGVMATEGILSPLQGLFHRVMAASAGALGCNLATLRDCGAWLRRLAWCG